MGQVCEEASEQESGIPVKEHTRTRKKKAKRDDLYALLPIEEVLCDVPQQERLCPDCGAEMEHMGYTFIREELRITPAKIVRVRYMQEKLICPVCREEDDTTITQAKTPTALMPHSPASPECFNATAILRMEESRTLFWHVVLHTVVESSLKRFRRNVEKSRSCWILILNRHKKNQMIRQLLTRNSVQLKKV